MGGGARSAHFKALRCLEVLLELETPPKHVPEVAASELPEADVRSSSAALWTLAFFLVLWTLFYALERAFPYLKNGSDIVFTAKLQLERTGTIFPANSNAERVLIFGNSKVLAGFLPSLFDGVAAAEKLNVVSFNSGFPGSDEFLPELETLCKRGQAPNVLLLTIPWDQDPPRRNLFHLVQDDHAVIGELFPFRFWPRDFTSFLMTAKSHGGVTNFYKESQNGARQVVLDRGYYLITEQSRFPGGRIPDDFHLASDQPGKQLLRRAPAEDEDKESRELKRLVRQYHMRCYYVPYYLRAGEAAPPPAYNQTFAAAAESATSCGLLGPDYYLYPNRLFSDQTHLNTAGARVYTRALFRLIEDSLSQGHDRALQ